MNDWNTEKVNLQVKFRGTKTFMWVSVGHIQCCYYPLIDPCPFGPEENKKFI